MPNIISQKQKEYLDSIEAIENQLLNGQITDQQFHEMLDELREVYQGQGQV